MKRNVVSAALVVLGAAVLLTALQVPMAAQQSTPAIDPDDIGGVVTSAKGPEAGVWVIAETRDLPTGFRKIVVTDEQGRFVVPDLPRGTYNLWVRGYGLMDSARVAATPGRTVNLRAQIAPNPQLAAQIYPANYWWSIVQVPPKSAFPIDGIQSQQEWIFRMKGLTAYMQLGDKATREIPEQLARRYKTSAEAWAAWLKLPHGPANVGGLTTPRAVQMFAEWSDRIKAGEAPPAPPRPQAVERNVVITQWDWSNNKGFLHDEITTDKRNPTVNANGPVYGLEQFSADALNVLDPVRHTVSVLSFPVFDPKMTVDAGEMQRDPINFGEDVIKPARANLHNPMLDHKGRLWVTGEVRIGDNQPAHCRANHPSAKVFPLARVESSGGGRQLAVYDPQTKKWTPIDTCYGTHHLQFAEDANHTLFTSGAGQVVGFFNTKLFDETGDAVRAQNWCPLIVDTNGNGKPDAWTEPGDPLDPAKDMRVRGGGYGIMPNPIDGSVWTANPGYPGSIVRLTLGSNPPSTCLAEIYNSPKDAFSPKGMDVDRSTGVVWVSFGGSGHHASFDRRKCKVTSGPKATGDHCPEGWTLYGTPGPRFKGVQDDINTDFPYLNWVDQFNAFGLGANVPLMPGTNSDSIIALLPDKKQYVTLRVPYPLGFFARGLDGRIDDPKAGWKGRGLWSTFASTNPWHYEGGKGATSKAVKFQLRPDPLAH